MKEVALLICSLIAGAGGYLVSKFWMDSILRYLNIRHEVTSDLVFYANVLSKDNLCDEYKERHRTRREHNRRHAAEMAACYYRLPCWYKYWIEHRGHKPLIASRHLIGLSNSSNEDQADIHIQWLRKSLGLSTEEDV